MYMRFIGKNGSMGLKHGKVYKTKISTEGNLIFVNCSDGWSGCFCPYSSPQSLAANWEACNFNKR